MSPSTEHVTILLSIHDGEPWLGALLDSVRAQSHEDWTLVVRDDGSTDAGPALVAAAAVDDPRIVLAADDGRGNLGPARSFMVLLERVTDGYFAFCDQDDVWLPHKLAWSIAALRGAPPLALVATDAEVTDADGRLVSPSALGDRGVKGPVTLGRLLVNNVAIGATVVGTADLARAASAPTGDHEVLMHDWWCALVAAYGGSLRIVAAPTIRWRRHPGTVTGRTPSTPRGRARRRLDYLAWSIGAARLLLESPLDPVDPSARRQASVLASIDPAHPSLRRVVAAMMAGVRGWSFRSQTGILISVVGQRWAK